MGAVRDVAVLRFSEPVSGADTRRYFGRRLLATPVRAEQVHPDLWQAALAALRPGERLEIVSPTEVRTVYR
jgi:hypothetical protein